MRLTSMSARASPASGGHAWTMSMATPVTAKGASRVSIVRSTLMNAPHGHARTTQPVLMGRGRTLVSAYLALQGMIVR